MIYWEEVLHMEDTLFSIVAIGILITFIGFEIFDRG